MIKEIQQQEKLYSKQIKGLLERGNQTGNDTHERPVAKKKEGQAKETLNHQCQQALHAENRARRRAVKEFLKDYWVHLHNKCKEVKKKWI